MIWNDKEIAKAITTLNENLQLLDKKIEKVKEIAESRISDDEIKSHELSVKIESYHTLADEKSKQIENILESIQEINELYRVNKTSIEEAITASEALNIKVKDLQNITIEIATEQKNIQTEHANANANLATIQGIDTKIKTYETSSEANSKLITDLLSETQTMSAEVERLYKQIYGEDTVDASGKSIHKNGLKDTLTISYNLLNSSFEDLNIKFEEFENRQISEFEKFINEATEQRNELDKKIRSHLPNAVTAGLAGAYSEKREIETEEMKKSDDSFTNIVRIMILFAFLPTIYFFTFFFTGTPLNDILLKIPYIFALSTPVYLPLIWIGMYTNRKINESKKLIEEYAYKEAVCKTFAGMNQQIEILQDTKTYDEMHRKLINLLIDASGDNPGKYINKYDKSDHPITELASNLTSFNKLLDKTPILKSTLNTVLSEKTDNDEVIKSKESTEKA